MFTVADGEKLRARLIDSARSHPDIEAAALLGSAARGEEDRWSDLDLALGLAPGVDPHAAAETWTAVFQQTEPVVDDLDLEAGGGLYRVLLLASTLQVDLSFWPHGHLPAGDSSVEILFGDTAPPAASPRAEKDPCRKVRMSWLYALHVRSAVGRGHHWQALWLLEKLRHQVIALLCHRHGLPSVEGRGVDRLPSAVLGISARPPDGLEAASMTQSFERLIQLLAQESEQQALPVPAGIWPVLDELVSEAAGRG